MKISKFVHRPVFFLFIGKGRNKYKNSPGCHYFTKVFILNEEKLNCIFHMELDVTTLESKKLFKKMFIGVLLSTSIK